MSAYTPFMTQNLYDYVRANSLSDEDVKLREELALAKHTLGSTLKIYSSLCEPIEGMEEAQRLQALQSTGDYLRKSLVDIAKLAKYVVDVESALAAQFNGVQVLSAIDQIVNLLQQEYGEVKAQKLSRRIKEEVHLLTHDNNSGYSLSEEEFTNLLNSVPTHDK